MLYSYSEFTVLISVAGSLVEQHLLHVVRKSRNLPCFAIILH